MYKYILRPSIKRSISCVILNLKEGINAIYNRGVGLRNWLHRNAFEKTNFKGLLQENISNVKCNPRKVKKIILSVETGQGFKMCSRIRYLIIF